MRENRIAIEDYDQDIPAGWYTVEFWDESGESAVYTGDSIEAYFFDPSYYCSNLVKCGIASCLVMPAEEWNGTSEIPCKSLVYKGIILENW